MGSTVLGLAALITIGGCAGQGRYQLGERFPSDVAQNVSYLPVLDTQTGRLWVWDMNVSTPDGWELHDLGRIRAEEDE